MTQDPQLERDVARALHELFPDPHDVSLLSGMQEQLNHRHRVKVRSGVAAAIAAVVTAVVVPLSLSAGNSGRPGPTSSRSSERDAGCAFVVDYNGSRYVGVTLQIRPPYDRLGTIPRSHRTEIGRGTVPPCNDTNSQTTASREAAIVDSIDGVSPDVAIALDSTGQVYLRRGATLPSTLPSQPWIRWTTL